MYMVRCSQAGRGRIEAKLPTNTPHGRGRVIGYKAGAVCLREGTQQLFVIDFSVWIQPIARPSAIRGIRRIDKERATTVHQVAFDDNQTITFEESNSFSQFVDPGDSGD